MTRGFPITNLSWPRKGVHEWHRQARIRFGSGLPLNRQRSAAAKQRTSVSEPRTRPATHPANPGVGSVTRPRLP